MNNNRNYTTLPFPDIFNLFNLLLLLNLFNKRLPNKSQKIASEVLDNNNSKFLVFFVSMDFGIKSSHAKMYLDEIMLS